MRLAGEEYFLPALFESNAVVRFAPSSKPRGLAVSYAKVECTVDEPVRLLLKTEGPEHALATEAENRSLSGWSFRAASLEYP